MTLKIYRQHFGITPGINPVGEPIWNLFYIDFDQQHYFRHASHADRNVLVAAVRHVDGVLEEVEMLERPAVEKPTLATVTPIGAIGERQAMAQGGVDEPAA